MRKRITFERSEQRADVAKKIKQEAEQLQGFFRKVGGDMADFDSPFKGCRIALYRNSSDLNTFSRFDIGTEGPR